MEETPKKCKDIIKTARSLLNDVQFAQFGDDPKVRKPERNKSPHPEIQFAEISSLNHHHINVFFCL